MTIKNPTFSRLLATGGPLRDRDGHRDDWQYAERVVLALLLIVSLLVRSAIALRQTNVFHPDEVFQYLEQGHRLAFGSGIVPWEFDYGIRSWLLPGLIATVMRISSFAGSSPLLYLFSLRLIAAALSLTVIYFGFNTVLRAAGLIWATLTGLFCATWFDAIFFSSSLLTEVLAAYLMMPAVFIAERSANGGNRRTTLTLGLLLGLTFCLRFQMAPALFVIACWYCRDNLLRKWLPLSLAAGTIVFLASGVLDYVTLGTPFQSLWLNFYVNAVEGVSHHFGRQPWFRYVDYLTLDSLAALPLAWLVLIGSLRAPLLGLTSLTIVITHSILAHKEYRFIAFVLLSLPILIALGGATLADILRSRVSSRSSQLVVLMVALLVPAVSYGGWRAGFPVQYTPNKGILRSFLAAHSAQSICGLGVADYAWGLTGGYSYLNRDIPLYYSKFLTATDRVGYYGEDASIPASRRSPIPLRMHVEFNGKFVPQFPGDALFKNASAFNYVIAREGHDVAGYTKVACFPNESYSPWPAACLLRRWGNCSSPMIGNPH